MAEGGTSTTDAKESMDRRRPDLAHRISEVRIAFLEERGGVGDALAHPSGRLPSGGVFKSAPDRADLGMEINENLIVELYSK